MPRFHGRRGDVPASPLPGTRRMVRGVATETKRDRDQRRRNLRRFLIGNRLHLVGVVIGGTFLILSLVDELVAPYGPNRPAPAAELATTALQRPSWNHVLDTDEIGRDVFSRIIAGARTSFEVALVVLTFAVVTGTTINAVSGCLGGWRTNC